MTLLDQAVQVIPSERQWRFMQDPFYAFVHFTVNTYTGKEWGDGTESPSIFNPAALDCDSWVAAIKAAGMTGLVLTAKHHDGFCLWPSKYTEHSVKNSPWKNGQGDVVREVADACRRGGIRFGFYLSPWDRHSPLYGTDAYNDYYKAQLTELLTQYGDIFYVWFDGACGEGPSGRKQVYDFSGYIELVRRYQPNACIFSDAGPDIRWCGNESGSARPAEWAVVPRELCPLADCQQMLNAAGSLPGIYNTWQDLGSESLLRYASGLTFAPAEVDMSIRPGWFYHPEEEPHSLDRLLRTYMQSVGGNAAFHLNIPPMPNGLFDPRDVQRLRELGNALRALRACPVSASAAREDISDTQTLYRWTFDHPVALRCVELAEDMHQGQRVEQHLLRTILHDGQTRDAAQGQTIGFRRLHQLDGSPVQAVELLIIAARGRTEVSAQLYAE